jgi:hypothetical protein
MDPNGSKIRDLMDKARHRLSHAENALDQFGGSAGGGASPGAGFTGARLGGSGANACPGNFVNQRGDCAHPTLQGEYGAMSWDEYDSIKRSGRDPRQVSHENLNKPMPWLMGPNMKQQ